MNNQSENHFLDVIYDENKDIYEIVEEIKNFNKNFGFIETFATSMTMKINEIILLSEEDEDYFEEEREYLAERILRLDDALMEMGLATYEYRGEEFYEKGKISAFGGKIGIKISDNEVFKEFISNENQQNKNALFKFIYSCILDSLSRESFTNSESETSQNNLDIVGNLFEIGDISHEGLKELVTDYNNLCLHQSLQSKFYITKFRDFFRPKSIEYFGNFQQLETIWAEGFGVFESLLKSTSQEGAHGKYILELGAFLEESLNYTSQLILQEVGQLTKRIPNPETSQETIKFKSLEHLHFIQKFYHLYDKRKYFIHVNMDI